MEASTPQDRGDITGESTDFSSLKVALHAVKRTEEGYESNVGLARHRGMLR
jgi:hypothetical protein